MQRSIALLLIGFVLGGMTGFVSASGSGFLMQSGNQPAHEMSGNNTGDMSGHGHDHSEILSLPGGGGAPTLSVAVHDDPESGWNLHIMTENFQFSPQNASRSHVEGEGHAHVYVNGEKFARHYGSWIHVPSLNPGQNEIEVTLNSNDHRLLAVDGVPLKTIVMVHSN